MLHQTLSRIERIDALIRARSTGAPCDLAVRLGISERALFNQLTLMKTFGAPICYCKIRKTYYYAEKGSFQTRFVKE